jgi:hypothetical protein
MSVTTQVKNFGSFGKNTLAQIQNAFVQKDSGVSQTSTLVSPLFFRWNGMSKFFDRPTTDAFCIQAKSEYTGTASNHALIEATCDWKGNGTTGGRIQAVQAVGRIASTFTLGAASAFGSYNQFANNGTINSASAFAAASYHLLEDGGVYTAVDHVASAWFDTHLTKTVSAGSYQMFYITNNGTTQMDQVFYIYGGNKITSLFELDTCGGMVDTGGTLGGTLKKIAITIGASTYYLIAGTTVS